MMNLLKPYAKAVVAALTPIVLNGIAEFGDVAVNWTLAAVTAVGTSITVWATSNSGSIE